MNIGSTTSAQSAAQTTETGSTKSALQALLLKKSLDNQESAASQILQQLDGKGQNVDIRA